jgi:hypothetical protein
MVPLRNDTATIQFNLVDLQYIVMLNLTLKSNLKQEVLDLLLRYFGLVPEYFNCNHFVLMDRESFINISKCTFSQLGTSQDEFINLSLFWHFDLIN